MNCPKCGTNRKQYFKEQILTEITKGEKTIEELSYELKLNEVTMRGYLDELVLEGKIINGGQIARDTGCPPFIWRLKC